MSFEPTRVGLIGLGLLGSALADRLLGQGIDVIDYDLDSAKCDAFASQGGQSRELANEVIAACNIILLSLTTSQVVSELLGVGSQDNSAIIETLREPRETT